MSFSPKRMLCEVALLRLPEPGDGAREMRWVVPSGVRYASLHNAARLTRPALNRLSRIGNQEFEGTAGS
jgi:hypothetical protein